MARRKGPRKAPVNRVLEKHVLRAVKFALELNGCTVWRRNVGAMRNAKGQYVSFAIKGQADLYGILPGGRHFECEVKRPRARPRKDQVEFLEAVNRAGGLGFWVDDAAQVGRVLHLAARGCRVVFTGPKLGDYVMTDEEG